MGLLIGLALMPELGRPASAQATPVDMVLGEYVFDPAQLLVPAGLVTFNFTNVDSRRHNIVIDLNAAVVGSEEFAGGTSGTWEVTLDQPGTYQFWCDVDRHAERGMVGTITVQ